MFDEQVWLAPVVGDNVSGISLRHENKFAELERKATPQFVIVEDDQNNPVDRRAEQIDWSNVLDLCEDLAAQGRDIRLLTILARALFGTSGLSGGVEGLALITASLDQYWDSIHPMLRGNGADATRRKNALLQLLDEDAGFFGDLMRSEAFNEPGFGSITFAELAQASLSDKELLAQSASGLGDAEKSRLIETHHSLIQTAKTAARAKADNKPGEFKELGAGITALLAGTTDLEAVFESKLGRAELRLTRLKATLAQIEKTLSQINALSELNSEEPVTETVTNITEQAAPVGAQSSAREGQKISPHQLRSREEVQDCLQLIIDFYERTEPSSPIPLLATRLKKMVPMDFLELMQELAPSGLKEFNNVAGKFEKK